MYTINGSRNQSPLARLGSRITVWVLGTGLLSLHLTVFTLTIIGMVFWNIYDSPDDLWVADLFRRWGVLLLFHAIAVAAGWTAWRLLRAEQDAIHANRNDWVPTMDPRYPPVAIHNWQSSTSIQPTEQVRQSSALEQTGQSLKQFAAYSAVWTSKLGRATSDSLRSMGSVVSRKKTDSTTLSSTLPPSPVQAWPEGPIRYESEEDRFNAEYASPNGGNQPGVRQDSGNATSNLPYQETAQAEPTIPTVGKDAGQTWVEAATAGWLLPREDSQSDHPATNGQSDPKGGSPATSGDSSE